jgi:hypothetical protein
MTASRSRLYKPALLAATIPLLVFSGLMQRRLNSDRIAMGITRGEPLGKTAPPVLVFTTVALGGFRGLIANALWIRAMDLQDQDKYFEKVQLADWITKLQPHFTTVWVVQAWDMAYNISIKFNDPRDRWQWVLRAIELLRDEGLKYNPDETMIYRELAWIFHHKIGQDLDDANRYYKTQWAHEMDQVLHGTNYQALIHPQTDDEKERSKILREKYKLDPVHMKGVDDEYGPLEWRLPESHSIYWATLGLKRAKKQDQITLRREIYQPLQLAFQRGRLILINVGTNKQYQLGPNLAMIPNANKAYEKMMNEDPEFHDHIAIAHRNFLKDAVYFLYTHNRHAEAQQWMSYLVRKYPDASFSDARSATLENRRIADLTLDEYCVARVTEDVGETSGPRVRQAIEGFLVTSFYNSAIGEDDQAAGYALLAEKVWARYQRETLKQKDRIGLPPLDELKRQALQQFDNNYDPLLIQQLRTRLPGLPPSVPPSTNTPSANPQPASTSNP